MHSRFSVSLLAVLALSLAGCNGQEDFSGAIIGGNIIDDSNPNPNFDPDNACQSRVVGNLVDSGIVANIGYECGGYRGYTGSKGIPSEVDQNRFVCPLYSTSVRFFLGGRNDPREYLGTANFRVAGPAGENFDQDGNSTCQYNEVSQEYEAGSVYDADGPYLFAVADLYDGPVRVDVITDDEPNEQAAQNLSALLTGLDSSSDPSLVLINDEAHRVVFDLEFLFADDFFDKPFADFVAATPSGGEAQDYLDLISAGAGPTAVGMLPINEFDVEETLGAANFSTAAGIYQFDLRQEDYLLFGYLVEQGQSPDKPLYNADALLTDYLLVNLQAPDMSRADPSLAATTDLVPFVFARDYLPSTLVDRHNRLIGGGSFDVARITLGESGGIDHLCGEQPLYLALGDTVGLGPDLTFENMVFEPVPTATLPEVGTVNIPGRFIDGVAYSGLKSDADDTQVVPVTDYELAYQDPTHIFDESTDRSLINTTSLCGSSISNQMILSYRRQGLVAPKLDPLIMDNFFPVATPGQYTLNYLARDVASAVDPNVVSKDTLKITIHNDGSILTDLNVNDNSSYDLDGFIPSGEYVVGMVSSIIAGEEDISTVEEEYLTEAQINVLVFTLGPEDLEPVLPAYGSHFRARIVPDTTCNATNAFWLAGDDTLSTNAYWFDSYNITNWLRGTTEATTPEERYEALRTIAYGFVEGVRTDCP